MPHAKREDYNKYIKTYLKRRYDERRAMALEMLGGKCVKCNSDVELQFDHIDPEKKLFDIADRLAQYTWSRLVPEIMKCQLLCFECHCAKSGIEQSARQIKKYAALRAQRELQDQLASYGEFARLNEID